MKKLSKTERKKMALLSMNKMEAAERVLRYSNIRFKRFDEVIRSLYRGENLSEYFLDRRISSLYECFRTAGLPGMPERETVKDVCLYLHRVSRLMGGEELIKAVHRILGCRADWIRKIEDWKPGSSMADDQLKELVHFLFCRYPVPGFLYKVFRDTTGALYIEWLIRMGRGEGLKTLEPMPVPLNRKAFHFFQMAPEKMSVPEAIRWAQSRGYGASAALAERIAYSWLSVKPAGDESFWESFIALLAKDQSFDHYHTGELIDYVREQKRNNRTYSLKGRTTVSLLRQSNRWHRQISAVNMNSIWQPSGIDGVQVRKKEELLVLEELNSQKELMEEGRTMKHCVASYAFYCAAGRTAIFSMRKYLDGQLVEKLATIEVNLNLKRIVQAKAKMNRPVSEEALKMLTIWAGKENLTLGPYL